MTQTDFDFQETIITIPSHPGEGTFSISRKWDMRLVDLNGDLCQLLHQLGFISPDILLVPEHDTETIDWNPKSCGVDIAKLEKPRDWSQYKELRYGFMLQMKEVGNTYWIKIWNYEKGWRKDASKRKESITEPEERQPGYQLSQNLVESLQFGDQSGRVVDAEGVSTDAVPPISAENDSTGHLIPIARVVPEALRIYNEPIVSKKRSISAQEGTETSPRPLFPPVRQIPQSQNRVLPGSRSGKRQKTQATTPPAHNQSASSVSAVDESPNSVVRIFTRLERSRRYPSQRKAIAGRSLSMIPGSKKPDDNGEDLYNA
jgi:hypothetical protein